MATDPKSANPAPTPELAGARSRGVYIFTYPKIIFIWPTFLAALVCGLGMMVTNAPLQDPTGRGAVPDPTVTVPEADVRAGAAGQAATNPVRVRRFNSSQNLFGVAFLGIFALNMLVMSMDFPRFTLVAGVLMVFGLIFFLLWIGIYFQIDLTTPVVDFLEGIFAVANAQFYFLFATILGLNYVFIFLSRWLDYWEIRPNEILHHHGPMSDLERYPTMNLKFDKEIPDVLEYLMLGAGRLVLHMGQHDRRAVVLDNVLWINAKEDKLKNLMSRMEVRVTNDQEIR